MNRPVPVVLSAILLGILTCFQLLAAATMIILAVVMLHKGLPVMTASPSPLPASAMPVIFFGLSILYVAVAVWFIFTLVGLVRLRSWARYSVLVIAGLITFFGAVLAVITFATPLLMPETPGVAPAPAPAVAHGIFLFIGLLFVIFTAIGIAQLVYFNRAATRAVFELADPVVLGPPNTFTGRYRPTAVNIISWFFMVCSFPCLFYAFFPFPVILFGLPIYGFAAHAVYVGFFTIGFGIGYGLYRLRPQAPIALAAWMIFGILNLGPILTPWGQRNFAAYMDKFAPPHAATPNMTLILGLGGLFGFVLNGLFLWLLYRHRAVFTPAPPAPPMPPSQFIDAPAAG